MILYATCDCGWQVQGTERHVVDQLRHHGTSAHGIALTEDQVLAVSRPVTPQPDSGQHHEDEEP